MRRGERGAVLIMALLIVALVAGLAVSYASQMQLVHARAFNRFYGAQQEVYTDSMIEFAKALLKEDRKNGQTDYLEEDWAFAGGIGFPVEGGYLQGEFYDAQAKLNLNSLASPIKVKPDPLDPERFSEAQRRFIRFLQTFDGSNQPKDSTEPALVIDLNMAVAMTEALVDWLDPDDSPSGYGGAESLQYQQGSITWVPPNGPLESLEELKLIQHFTPEIFDAIRPFLVVLPSDGAGLNINTLIDLRLKQSLGNATDLQPLSATNLVDFDEWRGDSGFAASSDLATHLSPLLGGGALITEGLAVGTEYFWLVVNVQLDDKIVNRRILIHRDDTGAKVVARFSSGQSTALQALAAPDNGGKSAADTSTRGNTQGETDTDKNNQSDKKR